MSGNSFEYSERLKLLPPYLFVEVDRMKQEAISRGVDIINLGVGDPDIPTPKIIRKKMKKAVDDPNNHQYPIGKGKSSFREEVRGFLKRRFNLDMDPETQIHPLIGSKEGIAHFPLAFINPGDTALIPEPAYPVYNSGTIFAGGRPYFLPLKEENDFLPVLENVPGEVLNRAKIIYINYPNNPTGSMASREFFRKVIETASKYGIIVVHDAAYSELYYDEPPLSLFEIEGGLDVGIEFHSLSKTFSMTGWRIGWACGKAELISGLAKVKDNIDSGVFGAIQDTAMEAFRNYDRLSPETRQVYKDRARVMTQGLESAGWRLSRPKATFYIWARPPVQISSADAVKKLIKEAGIICTPGSGFGPSGEGFVRFALTKDEGRIKEGIGRIRGIEW